LEGITELHFFSIKSLIPLDILGSTKLFDLRSVDIMATQKYNKLAGKHVLIIGGTSGKDFILAHPPRYE